jgi:hypothetical protein
VIPMNGRNWPSSDALAGRLAKLSGVGSKQLVTRTQHLVEAQLLSPLPFTLESFFPLTRGAKRI